METGGRANEVGTRLEGNTACSLGILQVVDRGKMPIGQRSVGEWPEMFGRLELGRIRRQEEQVNMLGNAQLEAGMPARTIQHQHDLPLWASADLARKLGQLHFEEWNADRSGQMKDSAALRPRGGMHKTDQIAPIVAVLDRCGGAHAVEAPGLVQNGFQADAVFVDRPELDARLGVRGRDRLDDRTQLF